MSGFFSMSSTRLDILLTFRITDCGACNLLCKLLFFRRYGQKVGPAAVSIGYRSLKTQQTAFYVGLLAKRQACLHFALYKKSYTCVWGRGKVYQLNVNAHTCWMMSSTCCVKAPCELPCPSLISDKHRYNGGGEEKEIKPISPYWMFNKDLFCHNASH